LHLPGGSIGQAAACFGWRLDPRISPFAGNYEPTSHNVNPLATDVTKSCTTEE